MAKYICTNPNCVMLQRPPWEPFWTNVANQICGMCKKPLKDEKEIEQDDEGNDEPY